MYRDTNQTFTETLPGTCKSHPEGCSCNAARAFAMFGIAIASAKGVAELPEHYTFILMNDEQQEKMRAASTSGQITTLLPNPEPYRRLQVSGSFGTIAWPYGVWLERKASFYGKKMVFVSPLKQYEGEAPTFEGEPS